MFFKKFIILTTKKTEQSIEMQCINSQSDSPMIDFSSFFIMIEVFERCPKVLFVQE